MPSSGWLTNAELSDLQLQVLADLGESSMLPKLFKLLLSAYQTGEHCTDDELRSIFPSGPQQQRDERLRGAMSRLRRKFTERAPYHVAPYDVRIEILERRPCRLELHDESSYRQRLWRPHTVSAVTIQVYERLFFRYKNIYIRDLGTNESSASMRVAQALGLGKTVASQLRPSMHYVSSGELQAAILLQNLFLRLKTSAYIHSGPSTPSETGDTSNLIVMGAARLGVSGMWASREKDVFEAAPDGIHLKRGKGQTYRDREMAKNTRLVHVLLSRLETEDGKEVKTVMESSHGRALQGLCEHLKKEDLCKDVVQKMRGKVPKRFQAVFEVELGFDLPKATSMANRVQLKAAQSV